MKCIREKYGSQQNLITANCRCQLPLLTNCRFLSFMKTFGKLFDDLFVKRRKVFGFAARYQAVVGNDFAVSPFCARVFKIGFERCPGRNLSVFDDPGFDQCPRRVTNCADGFAGFKKRFDKTDRFFIRPQFVGIHHAARKLQSVKVFSVCFVNRQVNGNRFAPIIFVPAFDLARFERNDLYVRARFFESFFRLEKFALFKSVGC